MKYIYIGKIVNTFGIKGELKIVSNFEMPEKVFINGNNLRINNNDYKITSVRIHKNNYLIKLNNIDDINDIEYLKGYEVFFAEEDLKLKEDEYLISELVNYKVYEEDTFLGTVTNADSNKINPLIKINNNFYIPIHGDFILKIDKKNQVIKVHNTKGLL